MEFNNDLLWRNFFKYGEFNFFFYIVYNQIYNRCYSLFKIYFPENYHENIENYYSYLPFSHKVISFIRASPLNLSNCLWIK